MHAQTDFVTGSSKPFAASPIWRRWKDKLTVKFTNDINSGQLVVAASTVIMGAFMLGIYWNGVVQLQKDVTDIKASIANLPVWASNLVQLEKRIDQETARQDAQSQRLGDIEQREAGLQAKLDDIIRASHINMDRNPEHR